MRDFIIRTLDHLVLVQLLDALETETVTARQTDGLFIVVVVRLEANATFEDRFH